MDWDEIRRAQEAQRLLNDPGVREALKQQQRLRDAGVDLTRLSEQAALSRDVLSRQPYTANVKQLLEVIETLRRPLPPEWVQARQDFNEFSHRFGRGVTELRAAIELATGPVRNFFQQWQDANRVLNEVFRSAPTDSLLGLMAWQATSVYEANASRIERGIAERNLITTNPTLAADMLLPAVSYLDFSQRTLRRIADSEDGGQRAALGGSLVVAEEHVTDSTRLIVELDDDNTQASSELVTVPSRTYAIYEAVQLDLIDVGDLPPEATYPVLVRFSSAASLAELTRQTLNAVLRCNKASKLQGKEEIFKSTNQAQEALVMLPGIVVRDESSLRDFITYLYMLIYEGAGDQKLRFLKDHGGPMERDECDAIWNLKALRNKWLIHDPEHGDSKSIDRSYRTLAEGLKNLGLSNYPSIKAEFEDLQRRVLSTLLDFHSQVEHRIAAGSN
jgi:hypothetical protein